MKTVEFDRYTPPYNPGERATFGDAEADVMINGGAAHLIGEDDQAGSPNQSQVIVPEMKGPYPADAPTSTISTKPAGGEQPAGSQPAGNTELAGADATKPAPAPAPAAGEAKAPAKAEPKTAAPKKS